MEVKSMNVFYEIENNNFFRYEVSILEDETFVVKQDIQYNNEVYIYFWNFNKKLLEIFVDVDENLLPETILKLVCVMLSGGKNQPQKYKKLFNELMEKKNGNVSG